MAMDIDELSGQDILRASDVDARIKELDALYAHAEDSSEWEQDYVDEYAALLKFREDVKAVSLGIDGDHGWNDTGYVSENYWVRYAYEYACDIYGREAVDTVYWDDEKFAQDLAEDYKSASLNGVKFYFN